MTNFKHLSSYNWIDTPNNNPKIVVPGCPPLWSPPKGPQELKKDSVFYYNAPNAAHHHESPLEPPEYTRFPECLQHFE
jgi:hypothetical protein